MIRDESIQPAEASVTSTDSGAQNTTFVTPGCGKSGNEVIQPDDITLHDDVPSINYGVAGKTATTPKPIISLFNTRPKVNAPSVTEILSDRAAHRQPMINTDNKT